MRRLKGGPVNDGKHERKRIPQWPHSHAYTADCTKHREVCRNDLTLGSHLVSDVSPFIGTSHIIGRRIFTLFNWFNNAKRERPKKICGVFCVCVRVLADTNRQTYTVRAYKRDERAQCGM